MSRRVFLPIVVKVVAMPLQMIFVESSALDLDKQMALQAVCKEHIRPPAIDDDLSTQKSQPRLDEQVRAVGNCLFHLDFEHDRTIDLVEWCVNVGLSRM